MDNWKVSLHAEASIILIPEKCLAAKLSSVEMMILVVNSALDATRVPLICILIFFPQMAKDSYVTYMKQV